MNTRQRSQRIRNLDVLYLSWDSLIMAFVTEKDPDEKKKIMRLANRFRKRYDALVADRRRVNA